MPLTSDSDGNGALEIVSFPPFESSSSFLHKWNSFGREPTSVLDSIGSPTSTSTLSSSLGGGSTTTLQIGNAAAPAAAGGGGGAGADKCGGAGMEDWDQEQEQSILRLIMGDFDDPSVGLNKLLQPTGGGPTTAADFEFHGGFNGSNPDFGLELDPVGANTMGSFIGPTQGFPYSNNPNYKFSNPRNPNLSPDAFNPVAESKDLKPQILNPPFLVNPSQITQNPSFFQPLQYPNQEHHHILHHGQIGQRNSNPSDSMLQLHPHNLNRRPHPMGQQPRPRTAAEEQQQGIIDQLYTAAELVSAANPPPFAAQAILARLNHQLSSMGKPFQRAAFFCKEALLRLHLHTDNHHPPPISSLPLNLILKIGAYKSFSEISPVIHFSNFTCNQALLEALDGYDRIHVIDFDIGYGGQWASLMHELSMRNTGALSLRITAFASPSTHDQLELGLTAENLNHFACEVKMAFEFDVMNLDSLNSGSWSFPFHVSENEAVAVNLPVGSFSNYQMSLPVILRFVKQLSPKIVVSMDRSCDRTDLSFPNHVIHTLQTCTSLLESLDASLDALNVNTDALQKIERFLIQADIEKIITGRFSSPEKTLNWRSLFLSSGFSPLTFSSLTESQADWVVKRTPVRGFHIERRQSSLVLCWQRKELISASAWKC